MTQLNYEDYLSQIIVTAFLPILSAREIDHKKF